MPSLEPWFFNSISLKHLATVKSVEVCWRQSQVGHHIKQFLCDNIFQRLCTQELPLQQLQNRVIHQFECFAADLVIPDNLKNDLCFYAWQMYTPLMKWLLYILDYMVHECSLDERAESILLYFIDNMVWNNVGRIDGRKMVESYVMDEESIDYETWVLLCKYCSEDYIRRFADGIDWTKGRIKSNIPIFWYYKIYGAFPTENMFASLQYYTQFMVQHQEGLYEEHNINSTLFKNSISCKSLAGVKYFWSRLTDSQKLEQFSDNDTYKKGDDAIALHILGQGKFNYFPTEEMDVGPWTYLLCWPWVLFIGSWMDKCRKMPSEKYITMFFATVQQVKLMKEEEGIEEWSRRLSMGHLHTKYYSPFAKLRSLCEENFGSDIDLIKALAVVGFHSEDITFCKIVMEGSANWRKMCMDGIVKVMKYLPRPPNLDFYQQFMDEALVNNKEKRIFKEIVSKNYGKNLN